MSNISRTKIISCMAVIMLILIINTSVKIYRAKS